MSQRLQTELRTYMSYLDTEVAPTSIDEVTEIRLGSDSVRPVGPMAHSAESRPRRRWLAASVAAAAVFIVIGGVALFTQAGSGLEVGSTPATEPTYVPGATPSLLTWSRIANDQVLGDGVAFTSGMRAVTVGGPGLVGVGEGDDGAAAWTSGDGFEWFRVPHDESVFAGTSTMWGVAAGGPGLVAVGGERGPEHESGEGDSAVWTSVDGMTWSRVVHDEAVFGGEGEQQMVSLTAGGPGLVAVGWDTSSGSVDAAVWTSTDGFT